MFIYSDCDLQTHTLTQKINKVFVETLGTDVYDKDLEQ